jgi:hypothetical protein
MDCHGVTSLPDCGRNPSLPELRELHYSKAFRNNESELKGLWHLVSSTKAIFIRR